MNNVTRSLRWSTVIALMLGALAVTAVRAQDTTRTSALSAPLLRALAVAADGYRTGRPVYFVMDMRPPQHVVAVYATRDDARRSVARDTSGSFEVFGPYITAPDPRQTSRVIAISMTVRDSAGTVSTFAVDPDSVDALFLTPGAVDRFLIPYYVWAYGPGIRFPLPAMPVCHAWGTFFCWAGAGGIRIMTPSYLR